MATATVALEEAVKEYLLFRGYVETLKVFEEERKGVKEKEYKAHQIVKHLLTCVYNSDLQELRKFWSLLSQKLFSRLASDFKQTLYKLETYLLRLYLVHAKTSGRVEAIRAFFETMSDTLATRKEWKEWFAFPYSSTAEQHPIFGVYFTREWMLTFRVSLKNFFDTVFTYLPKPMLLNFQSEHNKVQALTTENRLLHNQLADSKVALTAAESRIQHLDMRVTQLMINAVNADVKGSSPVRKTSLVKQKKSTGPEEFTFKRAQSMGSVDRPHKRIGTSPSLPSDDQSPVTSSGTNVSNDESSSSQPPLKNLSEGAKNVKLYSSPVSERAPFFVVQQAVYRGHSSGVLYSKFSVNGDNIASFDVNNVVKIWNSKQPHGTLAAAQTKASILSLEWYPTHDSVLLMGMNDGRVKAFNAHSAKFSGEMDCGHDYNQVVSLVHQPNSTKFACSATTGLMADKEKAAFGLMSPNLPSAKTFELHSKLLNTIYVWDLSSNSKESFEPLPVTINSMSFNHNGSLLVTGASDGFIRLFGKNILI
jgi:WD40 repeat protein